MTIEAPFIDGETIDTAQVRRMLHAALGGSPTGFTNSAGATDGSLHGVCGADHLKVTESETPGMSVDIAAGLAIIRSDEGANIGPLPFYSDAAETVVIAAAHSSLDRHDLIIAQVPTDGSSPTISALTGTPAAEPSDPSLASSPNALVLARVLVEAQETSITDADITDLRTFAGREGILRDMVAKSGTSSATMNTSIATGSVRVFRQPINETQYLITVVGTATNSKGSNWANGDLLFTIPAGYRGAGGFLPWTNISTNTVGRVVVDVDGTVDHAGGTVASGGVIVFSFSYLGTA